MALEGPEGSGIGRLRGGADVEPVLLGGSGGAGRVGGFSDVAPIDGAEAVDGLAGDVNESAGFVGDVALAYLGEDDEALGARNCVLVSVSGLVGLGAVRNGVECFEFLRGDGIAVGIGEDVLLPTGDLDAVKFRRRIRVAAGVFGIVGCDLVAEGDFDLIPVLARGGDGGEQETGKVRVRAAENRAAAAPSGKIVFVGDGGSRLGVPGAGVVGPGGIVFLEDVGLADGHGSGSDR